MKICYLSSLRPHTEKMADYFVQKGHDVSFIMFDNPSPPGVFEDFTIYNFDTSKSSPARRVLSRSLLYRAHVTRKVLKEIRPDILHAHYASSYGIIGMLSGVHPLVISTWGSDILIETKKFGLKPYLIKKALHIADNVHCSGNNTYEKMIEMGIEPQKIVFALFGIDTKKFQPRTDRETDCSVFQRGNEKIVISTRMLHHVYDVLTLAHAIPSVVREYPAVKFIFAGSGPLQQEIVQIAQKNGVLDTITFLGLIPNISLSRCLPLADIYVSTSLSDAGLAVSTAEAMACGLPVVITDFWYNREWVKDYENGFVVPVQSPDILAEKILLLLQDDALRERCGKQNRDMILKKFNYSTEMARIEKIYGNILNANGDNSNRRFSSPRE